MTNPEDGRLARGAVRRDLLLDSAVRVVASAGSGSLTHRAVASEAKVSVASTTYHFPSISDLRSATLEHAGSRIGMQLVRLVSDATASVEDTPDICAAFAVRLVEEQRVDTAAVFELIVAAGHDEAVRPVVAAFNGYLANVLMPYIGDREHALRVAAAIQGLLLVHLAGSSSSSDLGAAVADLIRRYRATPN